MLQHLAVYITLNLMFVRLLTLTALLAYASCVWAATDKCEAPSEYSVIEQCGWQAKEKADAEVKAVYGQLLSTLKANSSRRAQLVKSQQAWVTYRENTCGLWWKAVQYKTPWCSAELAQRRAKELTNLYECQIEGGGKC